MSKSDQTQIFHPASLNMHNCGCNVVDTIKSTHSNNNMKARNPGLILTSMLLVKIYMAQEPLCVVYSFTNVHVMAWNDDPAPYHYESDGFTAENI